MVTVTRLNGQSITLNLLLIESIEAAPDTVITLSTGNKLIVRESVEMVKQLVAAQLSEIGLAGMSARLHKGEGPQ